MHFSSQYGSYEVLNRYLSGGLRHLPQPASFHWQHGWIPRLSWADPDIIIGEGGWARFQKNHLFLVARRDQATALVGFGFKKARAIGLPFAYALKLREQSQSRAADSLLVMPADHQVSEDADSNSMTDRSYIESLSELRPEFTRIVVALHGEDVRRGRHTPWIAAGFEVIQGASLHDPHALVNLADLFLQTEYCTTNGLGSHIAYAAASGCKVSIWGANSNPLKNYYRSSFYQNRPDLVGAKYEWENQLNSALVSRGVYCHPRSAVAHRDWGLAEIGFDNVVPPDRTLFLLRELFEENPLTGLSLIRAYANSSRLPVKIRASVQWVLRRKAVFASYLSSLSDASNFSMGSRIPTRRGPRLCNLFRLLIPGNRARKLKLLDRPGWVFFRPWSLDLVSLNKVFGGDGWKVLQGHTAEKIIDVGAGLGYFSAMLAMMFPDAKIESLEPADDRLEVLKNQAHLLPQINPVKLAIGVREGTGSLVGGGGSKISVKAVPAVVDGLKPVKIVTLKNYLNQPNFEDGVDILRLSLGGMEYEVLRDSGEILATKVGTLIVKFNHVEWKKNQILEVHDFFAARGLIFFREIDEHQVFTSERVRANLTTL